MMTNGIKWHRSAIVGALLFANATVISGQTIEIDPAQTSQPSLLTPPKPQRQAAACDPITRRQRLQWFLTSTAGPQHLAAGLVSSAFGTAVDRPREYGPGWRGFGDRFGMRLTGISTGNAIEASIGALWGEDPRYFRLPDEPFKARVRNVLRLSFVARRPDASFAPAYARLVAVSGNNFLSNAWRADSEANNHDAAIRTLAGIAGRMTSNALKEFWPDVIGHLTHKKP